MQMKWFLLCSGNSSLHPFQSAFFFFFNLLFWANLGSQQNRAEVQRNPIHPGPHIHSPPHCWYPNQSGTFLTVSLFWDTVTSKVPQWFLPLPSKQYPGDSTASENAVQFSSVAQSCPTLCDPMDCSTRVYPNSCPLSWWCHPTILSSVVPFFSCPQSCPASGSFQMSQFFASGGQSIGVSTSASVLPMNTQDWSPLGWAGWISLQSKGLSRVFSNTTVQKHQFFGVQLSL